MVSVQDTVQSLQVVHAPMQFLGHASVAQAMVSVAPSLAAQAVPPPIADCDTVNVRTVIPLSHDKEHVDHAPQAPSQSTATVVVVVVQPEGFRPDV